MKFCIDVLLVHVIVDNYITKSYLKKTQLICFIMSEEEMVFNTFYEIEVVE